jgi:hypothetical protein
VSAYALANVEAYCLLRTWVWCFQVKFIYLEPYWYSFRITTPWPLRDTMSETVGPEPPPNAHKGDTVNGHKANASNDFHSHIDC